MGNKEAVSERSRPEAEQLLWEWLRFGWRYREIASCEPKPPETGTRSALTMR